MSKPLGIDKAAKIVGAKIKAIREARGLTLAQVAEQLACNVVALRYIEQGRFLPRGLELQRRLLAWFDGVSSEGKQILDKEDQIDARKSVMKNHTRIGVFFPRKGLGKKLKDYCERHNISQSEFCYVAVQRLLEDSTKADPFAKMFAVCKEARLVQALNEEPALRDLLDFEIEWAKEAKITHYTDQNNPLVSFMHEKLDESYPGKPASFDEDDLEEI